LLQSTITETITNPDWALADLADVRVPCLVAQGERDPVNAPSHHAETLHEWLPNSQLWIPAGVGHSVHWELPDEFERRAREFFLG
jgi:pimeloyl-ACP methyl ester carboxylesterase